MSFHGWIDLLFSILNNTLLSDSTTVYLFFHSIVDGHLGHFQIRDIMSSVTVNILELVF